MRLRTVKHCSSDKVLWLSDRAKRVYSPKSRLKVTAQADSSLTLSSYASGSLSTWEALGSLGLVRPACFSRALRPVYRSLVTVSTTSSTHAITFSIFPLKIRCSSIPRRPSCDFGWVYISVTSKSCAQVRSFSASRRNSLSRMCAWYWRSDSSRFEYLSAGMP